MVESSRETNGKIEYETRLYLTSLIMVASLMGPVVRSHWAIENSLHWVMDMMFRDDECRVRTEHAPANFTKIVTPKPPTVSKKGARGGTAGPALSG